MSLIKRGNIKGLHHVTFNWSLLTNPEESIKLIKQSMTQYGLYPQKGLVHSLCAYVFSTHTPLTSSQVATVFATTEAWTGEQLLFSVLYTTQTNFSCHLLDHLKNIPAYRFL